MRNAIAHHIASVPTFTLVRGVQSLEQSLRQKVVGASLVNSTDPEAIRSRVTTNAIRVLLWCEVAETAREAAAVADQARIQADLEQLRRDALLTSLSDGQRDP